MDLNYYQGFRSGTHHEAVTTEFEWALMRFHKSFERFCLQVASMSGLGFISFSELVLLHVIRMQETPKTAAILARQMNVDGITNVQYSLRKLLKYKLVVKRTGENSKVQTYEVTEKGNGLLREWGRVRRDLLTDRTKNIEGIDARLTDAAAFVSMLTGVYDEASRISASYRPTRAREAAPEAPARTRR